MRSILQLCFMLLMLLGAGNRAWSSVRCTCAYDAADHRTRKAVVGDSDLFAVTHGCSLANLLPVGRHADSPGIPPKWLVLTYDSHGLPIIKRGIGAPSGGPNRPSATAVVIAYQWDAQHRLCNVWMQIGPNVYAYVRQNPWTAFDPHGLELRATTYPNGKGGVHTRLELWAKVVNSSSQSHSAKEQKTIVKRMINALKESYKGKEGKDTWEMEEKDIHLEFVDRSKVGDKDHLFELVDKILEPVINLQTKKTEFENIPGKTLPAKYGMPQGSKHMLINNQLLNYPTPDFKFEDFEFERTTSHELGHSAGLFHPDTKGRVPRRNLLFNPGLGRNLMWQSKDTDYMKLNKSQIKSIQDDFDAKRLNLDLDETVNSVTRLYVAIVVC